MHVLEENIFDFGKFRLDNANKILRYNGEIVSLPLKSVELLCLLVENRSEVVTKQKIFDRVWQNSFVEDSVLTQNIYQLRKTFEELGEKDLIKTVPRRGYIFSFENDTTFTIEREIYEEIEITETETLPEKQVLVLPPKQTDSKFKIFGLAIAVLFLITSAVFGYWFLNKKADKTTVYEIKSIAVLPLKSFDEKAVDDNLRLRMMDSLITKLGKIETISVRPTSSTMKFLKSDESSTEIGKRLLVDSVLEGSIQREQNKIRVTLQLVSIKNGEQIWSEQFDGEADKLLDLQNAVSAKLLTALNVTLSNEQQTDFAKRPTTNSEAYEEYLKGRYFWNKRTPEGLQSAIISFEKAIKLDANFADAYVGLADSHYLLFDYSYDTSTKNVELAKKNLNIAIQLNPNLSEAYTTLGLIQTTFDWNWKAAEESLRKAKEIAANSPNAHHRLGTLLCKLRRFSEGEAEIRRAKELDPTSTAINMNLGFVLMQAKKNEEAIEQLRKTLDLDSTFVSPRWYLARTYWLSGNRSESLAEYVKTIDLSGDKDLAKNLESDIKLFGETTAIKNWAKAWENQAVQNKMDDHSIAVLYAFLNNRDETLKWLEKSVSAHHPWATGINAEPEFDFIRDEPRFNALLEKMNLNER
jgi:DNA-binding winged helix-turn-helix (wHTH) protein/TolB-like protein/Tfp pilus assembly protein PilF